MNGWNDWDRIVIDGLAPLVDLHSVHIYTGSDDYWTDVLQPHQADDGTLEERYSFPDALAVAIYLNIFIRNCD